MFIETKHMHATDYYSTETSAINHTDWMQVEQSRWCGAGEERMVEGEEAVKAAGGEEEEMDTGSVEVDHR